MVLLSDDGRLVLDTNTAERAVQAITLLVSRRRPLTRGEPPVGEVLSAEPEDDRHAQAEAGVEDDRFQHHRQREPAAGRHKPFSGSMTKPMARYRKERRAVGGGGARMFVSIAL